MIKIGIIGATGYTGAELFKLLKQHPEAKITFTSSESHAGQQLSDIYPHLKNQAEITLEKLSVDTLGQQDCDVFFIALPHGHSVPIAETLLKLRKKVIDLGADFRLKNPETYQHWYHTEPASNLLLEQAVYGLPEMGQRDKIKKAALIANPGCYPTASILAAQPLLKANVIDPKQMIFDAVSGISGAGRTLSLRTHFCEIADNFVPYQIAGAHRHTPEIEQALSHIANQNIMIQFTPHLVPVVRGLLVTSYFQLTKKISLDEISALYEKCYAQEKFIRLFGTEKIPQLKWVVNTNYCDIGFSLDERTNRLIVISAIDNLIKGAAGQAIQNMNIMFNVDENLGLSP